MWWASAEGLGPTPMTPLVPALLHGLAVLLVVGIGAAWVMWGHRRPVLLSDVTVAAVALFMSGSLLVVLSGTPWGLYGLFGDESFRTEAITRFTQSWANADYAYRGLPGHYPPLVPWLEGRVAVLFELPAWRMVKVGQVILAALVPLLSYVFWRRVVTAPTAAAVVAVTALFVGNMYKVDQWLVLAVIVPWWLDAFREGTRPGVRRLPAWVHGAIAGVLLTGYTFYFLPLAIATVVGMAIDLFRGRPWPRVLARPLVVTLVGLVVSAWYWLPFLVQRLQGTPMENYQTGWFIPRHTEVVSPLEVSGAGLVMLLGLVYLATAVTRHRAAEGLLLEAVAGYVIVGIGLVLTAAGSPILVFKANDYIRYVLVAAGVVGVIVAGRLVVQRAASHQIPPGVARAVPVAIAVMCLAGALHFVEEWTSGKPVLEAHATPLPDGSLPDHAGSVPDHEAGPGPADPVVELRRELGITQGGSPVLVTDRVDLIATTAIHPFITWTRPYSNPFGQFDERLALLDEMAAGEASEVARLARENPFDEIDGFVLRKAAEDDWTYRVRVDNFPLGTRYRRIHFTPEHFDDPHWEVTELDQTVVVEAAV